MRGPRSTFRLLRALWRYRGQLEAHGKAYQAELATAVRTALDSQASGRLALGAYRNAMRLMVVGAVLLAVLALLVGVLMWQVRHELALLAVIPLVPAAVLTFWRLAWGAPLDWLTEHADPERTVPLSELPARLSALARETRSMANVPARLSDELEELAKGTRP